MDLEENPLSNISSEEHHQDSPLWKEDENVNLLVGSRPEEEGAKDLDPTPLELLAVGEGVPREMRSIFQ